MGVAVITIDIPGRAVLEIEHVLLDYNGTIAADGALTPGVAELITSLTQCVHVEVLTAETYGTVQTQCGPLVVEVVTFPRAGAAAFKQAYAQKLEGQIACLGNGYNDVEMFDESDLRIAVLDTEGTYAGLLAHADILARSAAEALALLLNTDRIRATLRT